MILPDCRTYPISLEPSRSHISLWPTQPAGSVSSSLLWPRSQSLCPFPHYCSCVPCLAAGATTSCQLALDILKLDWPFLAPGL